MVRIRDNKTKIIHTVTVDKSNGGLNLDPSNDSIAALMFMTERWYVKPPPKKYRGFQTDSTYHRRVDFTIDGDLEYAARNLHGFSNHRFEMVEEESK